MNIFGETPGGIILLDFILLAMGLILSPLLWGIFKRLGGVNNIAEQAVKLQGDLVKTVTKIFDEMIQVQVRDKDIEGRLKGLNDKIDSLNDKVDFLIREINKG